MTQNPRRQERKRDGDFYIPNRPMEGIVLNPKAKLLDQVRDVMRLRHYSIRTEQSYCDWIKRYMKFHGLKAREELLPAEPKVESFLSLMHLAEARC